MVIFLTSSFVEYQTAEEYIPKPLDTSNQFGENLRKYWPKNAHFLVYTSDPLDNAMTDHVTMEMQDAFSLAGFEIEQIQSFDQRNIEAYAKKHAVSCEKASVEALREALRWADVIFLAGGHAPTENAFMQQCRLRELLQDREVFDGIVIGLSAGSMNAAEEVYLIPELEGESIDPNFKRFARGLGLSNIQLLPHYQYEKNVVLDGKKLIEEIMQKDSLGRRIYMIPDGAYFLIEGKRTTFFGEGKILENGKTTPFQSGVIKE